jgi:enoyl-CoA hydratase/carnithine racemase
MVAAVVDTNVLEDAMPYAEILYEISEGVATVTLNRPAKLNAWTFQMQGEVEDGKSG